MDAILNLIVSLTQSFIDYAFYPWVKERWAAGFDLAYEISQNDYPWETLPPRYEPEDEFNMDD